MSLPLSTRYAPVEAMAAHTLPAGPEWQDEPKWDGFLCVAFADHRRIDLISKAAKPLTSVAERWNGGVAMRTSICLMQFRD